MVNQDAPEVGDLVIDRVSGQVFGVSARRQSKKKRYLVDEKGELHNVEDCDRLNGSEITQVDIDDAIELVDIAIADINEGEYETAIAVLSALAAVCVTPERKRITWAGLRPDQRTALASVKASQQGGQAA